MDRELSESMEAQSSTSNIVRSESNCNTAVQQSTSPHSTVMIQSDRCTDTIPGAAHEDPVVHGEVAVSTEIADESNGTRATSVEIDRADCNEIMEVDPHSAEEVSENSHSERRPDEPLSEEESSHILQVESSQSGENSERRPTFDSEARHVVKFSHILKQLKEQFASGLHGPFQCGIENQIQIGEKRHGLRTIFIMQCEMCNVQSEILSELEDDARLDVNRCAVVATHCIGKGYAALEEFTANIGVHCMPYKLYQQLSVEIDDTYIKLADKQIIANGQEELQLAVAEGRVVNNIPTCAVIGDGSWPVTSYNKGARSESGMIILVSAKTKKILFKTAYNRYCLVCQRDINAGVPIRDHRCYVNWKKDESILGTESEGVVAGFRQSLTQHGLMYSHYSGDGDSSVHNRIVTVNPYDDKLYVEKINCRLHIQRCRIRDVRDALNRFKTGRDEMKKKMKCEIFKKIGRICKDVTSAASYWNKQPIDQSDKEANLRKDIMMTIHHVLGDHTSCAQYFCKGSHNSGEYNWIPHLKQYSLYNEIQKIMETWSNYAKDLLLGLTANLAECFNSVLQKFIFVKHVNVQLRGMYQARTSMAVRQFNTQDVGSALHIDMNKMPPAVLLDMEKRRQAKNIYNRKYKKIRKMPELAPGQTENMRLSSEYGMHPEKPDMVPEEYQRQVKAHWETLSQWQKDRHNIEQMTRNDFVQCCLNKKKLLVAPDFGRVCRMQRNTPTASTVEKILYPPNKNVAIKHYEQKMKRKIMSMCEDVQECGLMIDETQPNLAAHPDALIGDNTILIIQCPYNIREHSIEDALKMPKSGMKTLFTKDRMNLNPTHPLFYEIPGSLVITKRQFCMLAICTNNEVMRILIPRNDASWETVAEKLRLFYENYMIPEIVDSRKNRNMDLRDKVRPPHNSANTEQHNNTFEHSNDNCAENPSHDIGGNITDERNSHEECNDDNEAFMPTELCDRDYQIVLQNLELEDSHMNVFGRIAREATNGLYECQSPLFRDALERIKPIDKLRKHIQILNRGGVHWVCAYYDTQCVYIYDSLTTENTLSTLGEYYPYLRK